MTTHLENGPDSGTALHLTLQSVLDIPLARGLQTELGEALQQGTPVVLDASQVERADASILQLLCAFVRAATERGVGYEWKQVSDALHRAARLTGLGETLGLPPHPHGLI